MAGSQEEDQRQAQHFADGFYREYQEKSASAQAELAKRAAELDNTNKEITKLEATAPLARQQANNYQALLAVACWLIGGIAFVLGNGPVTSRIFPTHCRGARLRCLER